MQALPLFASQVLGGRVADRWAPKMQGGRLALPAIFLFIGTTCFTAAYLFRSPAGTDDVTWSVAGPAMQFTGVNGLVVTGNRQRLSSGSLARVSGGSNITMRGNITN